MNPVQAKPKFATEISEAMLIIAPVEVEVNGTVDSFLEYRPSSTSCCLVAEDIKSWLVVRFDDVHTISFLAGFKDFSTISESYEKKSNGVYYVANNKVLIGLEQYLHR